MPLLNLSNRAQSALQVEQTHQNFTKGMHQSTAK